MVTTSKTMMFWYEVMMATKSWSRWIYLDSTRQQLLILKGEYMDSELQMVSTWICASTATIGWLRFLSGLKRSICSANIIQTFGVIDLQ